MDIRDESMPKVVVLLPALSALGCEVVGRKSRRKSQKLYVS